MKAPYLVQRGKLKTDKPSLVQGIDSLVSFDYMGSAEFEFGALPKALKSIVSQLPNLVITQPNGLRSHDGQRVFVISTADKADGVAVFLNDMSEDKARYSLKERMEFGSALRGEKYADFNFWWDIENDWIAVLGKKNAELVILALDKVKEKKGW